MPDSITLDEARREIEHLASVAELAADQGRSAYVIREGALRDVLAILAQVAPPAPLHCTICDEPIQVGDKCEVMCQRCWDMPDPAPPAPDALREAWERATQECAASGWRRFQPALDAGWALHAALAAASPAEPAEPAVPVSRPKIVCFCGSSRFVAEMAILMWEWTKAGHITLGLQLLPQSYPGVRPDHQAEAEGLAAATDGLHLRKIDLADEIVVVNIDGYIGESTAREIAYAEAHGKPIRYLEPRAALLKEADDAE